LVLVPVFYAQGYGFQPRSIQFILPNNKNIVFLLRKKQKTMYKSIAKLLPVALVLATSFSACKKDKDEEQAKSRTTLLTQKDWFISKFEEKTNNGAWVDDYPNFLACERDNKQTFRTNNTCVYDEGATKCNSADPQTDIVNWSFTDNETKILLDGESNTIDQLDENSLVLSISETFQGLTYYTRITLRH
jgi:hypothetical protein